jgi:hypothetical protein
MYSEEPVTPEGLAVIFANLWQRGKDEFARNGISMQDAFRMFLHYAKLGRSGILLADGVPIMASGIATENGESFTWFQATEAFDRHAMQITKTLRREAKAHVGPLYIYSVLVHPQTERWFKALGFVRDQWEGKTAAQCPLFRFKRPICA